MPRHIMHLHRLLQQDGAARMQLKNCNGVVHGMALFRLLFVAALLQIISQFLLPFLPSPTQVSHYLFLLNCW